MNTLKVKVGQLGMVVRLNRPESEVPLGAVGEVVRAGLLMCHNPRTKETYRALGYAVMFPRHPSGLFDDSYFIEHESLIPINDPDMKEEESSENVKENIKEGV